MSEWTNYIKCCVSPSTGKSRDKKLKSWSLEAFCDIINRKLRLHSWLENTPTLVPWLHFLLLCLVRCLWVECLYSLFLSCAQLSSFLPAGDLLFWTLAALPSAGKQRSWEESCLLEAPGRIQQITNPQYQKQEIYEWMSKAVCMWYGIYYLTV